MENQTIDPKSALVPEKQDPKYQVPSQKAAPAVAYGIGYWFAGDPNHDLDALRRSRVALKEYRDQYDELAKWPYPLRTTLARHTGLPALLKGYLKGDNVIPSAEYAEQAARLWLSQPLIAEALFGVNWDTADSRLAFMGRSVTHCPPVDGPEQMQEVKELEQCFVHAHFLQSHHDWPVYGANVVVHLAVGDPRVAATSSYFPLKGAISLEVPVREEQARAVAREAALLILAQSDQVAQPIGLWWEIMQPWVQPPETGAAPALPWSDKYMYVLEELFLALTRSDPDRYADLGKVLAGGNREEMLAALKMLGRDFEAYKWKVKAVPYAGSLLFILPFTGDLDGETCGSYYLAYQIELESPTGDQAWRVFVDANRGKVLGEPESLIAQATIINNSGALITNTFTPLPSQALAELTEQSTLETAPAGEELPPPIGSLIDWRFHSDIDPARPPVDLSPVKVDAAFSVATNARTPKDKATIEAVNIAFHARRMYQHFVNVCGVDSDQIGTYTENNITRKLRVFVGKGGVNLDMFFKNTTVSPKSITFQSDTGGGLNAEAGKKVFNPSLDPEVIFHELAHGLMWMLNRAPFDQKYDNVPFGRAILEGYANYFARSFAASHGGDPDIAGVEPWARGAYRTDAQQWGDQWALGQSSSRSAANQLNPPNVYPVESITGMPVYDVGMIWARALWQIRALLGTSLSGLDLADHLALDAYQYVHGWVTNYEIAAEGLIDAAQKRNDPTLDAMIPNIIARFAARGILAERGVQAMAAIQGAAGNPDFLIGTDQGIWRFTPGAAPPWQKWDGVTDVIGIAADAAGIYVIATEDGMNGLGEQGVFQRDMQNNAWIAKGAWPAGETPLSILVRVNNIFVGTANGVYRLRTDAQPQAAWEHWIEGGISWKMTSAALNGTGTNQLCFISNLTSIGGLAVLAEQKPPKRNPGQLQLGVRLVDMAVIGNDIFATTAHHGIWRRQGVSYNAGPGIITGPGWTQISGSTFNGKGVLCLGIDRRNNTNRLLVGATDGLYEPNGGVWSRNNAVTLGTQVSCILNAGPVLLLGTTGQLVWVNNAQGWNSVSVPG